MKARAAAAAVLTAALLAACGTPSADLFVVERSGSLPGAGLDLIVGDGGSVRCDGEERAITSAQLLDARELTDDLVPVLERNLDLPAGEGLLRFRVIGEEGEARFSEASPGLPTELARVVAFTRRVAIEACGRPR